jgi:hypothetical protein
MVGRVVLVVLVLMLTQLVVRSQRRSPNQERVRAIERAEMDRLLVWSTPKDTEPEAVRMSRFKKIKDDFRNLQSLNNSMMADAWSKDTLNYSAIAEMVSKIRSKAKDLRQSLLLPEPEETKPEIPVVNTVRQFREELLLLDKTIMRFVSNPVFQVANALDVNEAKKASRDLEQVISLTSHVKQNADKFRKTAH